MSLFVFCLALSPALSAAASFLPANGVNAYADDCTLQGPSSAIVQAFQAFTDTAAKAHLYPKLEKCVVFTHSESAILLKI